MICFPGTVVERNGKSAAEFIFGIQSVSKGLVLAQVKEITGLDTPAIQNWVNRGWVRKPEEKRYSVNHLSRILIFNMLRDVMKFENIATLMTYINGSTDDRADDIIADSQMYIYICDILDRVDYEIILSSEKLLTVIENTIKSFKEPAKGSKEKLVTGLYMILVYYASAVVKVRADKKFEEIIRKKGGGDLC